MLFCIHENFIVCPPIYFDNSTLKCRQSCYFQLNLRRKTGENLYLQNLIHVVLAMDLLAVSLRNVTPLKNYIQCQSYTFLNVKGKRKNNIIYIQVSVFVPENKSKLTDRLYSGSEWRHSRDSLSA